MLRASTREVGGGIGKDFVDLCLSRAEGHGDLPMQPHHPLQAGASIRAKGDVVRSRQPLCRSVMTIRHLSQYWSSTATAALPLKAWDSSLAPFAPADTGVYSTTTALGRLHHQKSHKEVS